MVEIKTSYSLDDLGVTADDLILLAENGYTFEETSNIDPGKRDEILSKLYDIKHKDNQAAPAPKAPDYDAAISPASQEDIRLMKNDLARGEHLDLQDMASAIKGSQIVSKDMRAELRNVIEGAVNAEKLDREDIAALGYLLDELNDKHVQDKRNRHSVFEYREYFKGTDILEQAAAKLQAAEAKSAVYTKEDIEQLLNYGEMLEKKPEEVIKLDDEKMQSTVNENHQTQFAAHVEKCSALIKDYAEGRISVEPEAMDAFDFFLDKYGKDYTKATNIKGAMSYDITADAANASQRLAHERVELGKQIEQQVFAPAKENGEGNDAPKGLEYTEQELRAAHKTPGKHRSVRDWKILYDQIEHRKDLVTDKDREKARKKLDEDFERTANKGVKAAFAREQAKNNPQEEVIVVEEVTPQKKEYTQEEVKAARKTAPKKRDAEQWNALYDNVDHNQELTTDKKRSQKRKDLTNDLYREGRSDVIPVVIAEQNRLHPEHAQDYIPDDKKALKRKQKLEEEAKKQETAKKKEKENDKKKKKGFFARAWDWTKRNAKKIVGAVILCGAILLGAKSCSNSQASQPGNNDNNGGKDNKEIVDPNPIKPTIEKDTVDMGMAHQYAKRMGYMMSQERNDIQDIEGAAIARYLIDREAYGHVKDKVAAHMGIDQYSIDEQMAILATVCENTPKHKPVIEAMLNGKVENIASIAKLKTETAKFKVNRETATIEYTNPEQFTSQQGTKSIKIDKEKLSQTIQDNLYNVGNVGR